MEIKVYMIILYGDLVKATVRKITDIPKEYMEYVIAYLETGKLPTP